jgi:phosphosulfolactate synthase
MRDNPFTPVVNTDRCTKPRTTGLTMIADWGDPVETQRGHLSVAGPYIDLAKIAVGIAALLDPQTLKQKIDLYTSHDILSFPGGQFLEYSVLRNQTNEYLQACVAAGFKAVEVSDNLLEIDLDAKAQLICTARDTYGLRVLGEVGKKEGVTATNDLADDAVRCLEAGAERIFLEAADFFSGEVNEKQLDRIVSRCDMPRLIFELPGPWIEGITQSHVQKITRWLLNRFGNETNIANVSPENVLKLEALRQGIGVNAGG